MNSFFLDCLTPLYEYKDLRKRIRLPGVRTVADISNREIDELAYRSRTAVAFCSTLLTAMFTLEEIKFVPDIEHMDATRIHYIKETAKRSFSIYCGNSKEAILQMSRNIENGLRRRLKDLKAKILKFEHRQ